VTREVPLVVDVGGITFLEAVVVEIRLDADSMANEEEEDDPVVGLNGDLDLKEEHLEMDGDGGVEETVPWKDVEGEAISGLRTIGSWRPHLPGEASQVEVEELNGGDVEVEGMIGKEGLVAKDGARISG
jgi:hypothetical protein